MTTGGVTRPQRLRLLQRSYRTFMVVVSLATYAMMAPFGYVAFATLALLPTRDPVRRAHRLQGIMRRAFALLHHWLRFVRLLDYDPRRIEGVIPNIPCIVISNHPSLDDVTTVMSAVPRLCTAVNRRTFHRRWLRPLLEQSGQFSGGVHSPLGSQEVLDSAAKRLEQGFSVLVFPEGARSPPGYLRPFARGAFEIACREGVPVVPLLIQTQPRWLTREDSLLAPAAGLARKRVKILESMHPADFAGNSREMRDRAEAMYSRLLGTPVTRSPELLSRSGRRALPTAEQIRPTEGTN